jgi:hypothetical protein
LPQPSQADIEFMQGMIMHHSQAVEMTALIASHTENKGVRSLGAKISSSQSDEIRFMQRWLATRGQPTSMAMAGMPGMDTSGQSMALMPGMLTPEQMDALRKAKGAEFDRLFLTGMIQHHGGALVMVKDLFDTAGAGQANEPKSESCRTCWRRNVESSKERCLLFVDCGCGCFVLQRCVAPGAVACTRYARACSPGSCRTRQGAGSRREPVRAATGSAATGRHDRL